MSLFKNFVRSVSVEDFAKMIDHTMLRVNADMKALEKAFEEFLKYGFRCFAISPYHLYVLSRRGMVRGEICIASVIGFPNGYTVTEAKVAEARKLFALGAKEIDMVSNIQALKAGDTKLFEDDIATVVEVAKEFGGVVKVIIETGFLSDSEKVLAVEIIAKAGAHFVKTSTGFHHEVPGATIHDVTLLKNASRGRIKVKAAGGIRHALDAIALIEAGADVIGTSSATQIIDEYRSLRKELGEA
jgi:deoxyribose-phosphate aldolase